VETTNRSALASCPDESGTPPPLAGTAPVSPRNSPALSSPAPAAPWQDKELVLKKLNYYSRLQRIAAYLKLHATDPLSLEQAAKIACMERTSFSRFFSQAVGVTFREFLQQWRIEIAIDLMLKSDVSLTEIAFAAGFESISSFERTFKKLTTLNPSEYRRLLLEQYWQSPGPTTADQAPTAA
jgi:AraC-like DNA-binding protein